MLLISDTSQISYSEIQQAFVFCSMFFCFDVFHKARKECVLRRMCQILNTWQTVKEKGDKRKERERQMMVNIH